ncbi:hypothetical protein DP939_45110 [Spongiactinospora rosea]|uniref:Uncharacterized protein n=1 Tax=Spongiactinospora rosea TaxID=2248750 RepID=A0A366LDN9_9ACTN|nr:hypothetical protein DP939_45110 [Spongiactinospora rosea]
MRMSEETDPTGSPLGNFWEKSIVATGRLEEIISTYESVGGMMMVSLVVVRRVNRPSAPSVAAGFARPVGRLLSRAVVAMGLPIVGEAWGTRGVGRARASSLRPGPLFLVER